MEREFIGEQVDEIIEIIRLDKSCEEFYEGNPLIYTEKIAREARGLLKRLKKFPDSEIMKTHQYNLTTKLKDSDYSID